MDWNADIDDSGAGIGICPHCHSECRQDPDATVTRFKCQECGEQEQ